ncbi:hypothetical protein [Neorhizobium alkalisoli]|uniref:hypothetical protein n=1 Tax=Neorhizobium alkalisoli TaxID=528178 RepID=UPI000CF8F4F8|nr:hypothetical protein [Neorhizobium alkalisoli]
MRKSREITIGRIESAMLKCALLVDRYGDEMQPMLDRLEREWRNRIRPPAVDRVKAMLAEHQAEAGRDPA